MRKCVNRAGMQRLKLSAGIIHYIHELSGGAVMGEAMYYLCMLEVIGWSDVLGGMPHLLGLHAQ